MTGLELVAAERARHLAIGCDLAHDRTHLPGDLTAAALAYSTYAWWQVMRDASGNPSGWTAGMALDQAYEHWPFDADEFHPSPQPRENLARAAALLAAEIDRTCPPP